MKSNTEPFIVEKILLQIISNYIFWETCHLSKSLIINNDIIESLKRDFINQAYTLFLAKDKKDRIFSDFEECDDFKYISKFITLQRNNTSAHYAEWNNLKWNERDFFTQDEFTKYKIDGKHHWSYRDRFSMLGYRRYNENKDNDEINLIFKVDPYADFSKHIKSMFPSIIQIMLKIYDNYFRKTYEIRTVEGDTFKKYNNDTGFINIQFYNELLQKNNTEYFICQFINERNKFSKIIIDNLIKNVIQPIYNSNLSCFIFNRTNWSEKSQF